MAWFTPGGLAKMEDGSLAMILSIESGKEAWVGAAGSFPFLRMGSLD